MHLGIIMDGNGDGQFKESFLEHLVINVVPQELLKL